MNSWDSGVEAQGLVVSAFRVDLGVTRLVLVLATGLRSFGSSLCRGLVDARRRDTHDLG